MTPCPQPKQHILTVSLEDYFQGAAFRKLLTLSHWARFEKRVQQNTDRTLLLLAKHRFRATFFVSAWLAEQVPGIVQKVIAEGHEIGSSGVTQRSFRHLSPHELRDEARDSKRLLEHLAGCRIRGFRVADHLLGSDDLWALKILADEGYDYDSSLSPSLRRFGSDRKRGVLHREVFAGKTFYELPLPAANWLGVQVPIAGGNYFRQIPERVLKGAVDSWIRAHQAPFVFYFRIWDLDPEQPEITGAPLLVKLRHYRNAQRIPLLLERLLGSLPLIGISEYLELPQELCPSADDTRNTIAIAVCTPRLETVDKRPRITVVVPCFNESHSLSYLAKAFQELQVVTRDQYRFLYIFVDDGSSDETWATLQKLFGSDPCVTLLRHAGNRGITAATLTGVGAAHTELVCSLDCDCTYDPLELARLIPLAEEGVDCVTASPYHPDGRVLNLPLWRRCISMAASHLYRAVLGSHVHTFTSCFRVYRRSRLTALVINEPGFVGIAEILGKLHLQGARIEEHPATLAVRMLGRSKMKLFRNTLLHLRLLSVLAYQRFSRQGHSGEEVLPSARRREGVLHD